MLFVSAGLISTRDTPSRLIQYLIPPWPRWGNAISTYSPRFEKWKSSRGFLDVITSRTIGFALHQSKTILCQSSSEDVCTRIYSASGTPAPTR